MRALPTLKISISGVRGVVGVSLTPTLITRFAQAFGTYLGGGRVVIGRDTRRSGEMVERAVIAGLMSSGCRIVDLGVCPTPTIQLMVRRLGARGGVAITASHNPPEWNALKFMAGDGLFLGPAAGRELLDLYHQGDYTKVRGTGMRPVDQRTDALALHVQTVLDGIGPLPPAARRLRVAIDACNGAASLITPRLVTALGAEPVAIHVTPDGRFPRPAEPTPAALARLAALVRDERCDLGVALDMDGDRLALVSEQGDPIGEDLTLVLATEQVLATSPGPVVTNVATTDRVEAVARAFGVPVTRSRVGEAHVTDVMRRVHAVIGGEGNGGVIYPRVNFARDGLVGIALVLHLLARTGRTLSQLVARLPPRAMVKRQFAYPAHRIPDLVARLGRAYAGYPVETLDGVKVRLPHGWFLVRGSNTEPVVRLIVESETAEAADRLAAEVAARIESPPSPVTGPGEAGTEPASWC